MLVLSRKKGEVVRIGSEIAITVLEIRNGTVKLGFSCPREVAIRREEVLLAQQAAGLAHATSDALSGVGYATSGAT